MWKYFETNYGPHGRQAPINSWARFSTLGSPPHNLHVERYHRTIKTELSPNFSIPKFCIGLQRVEELFARKSQLVQDGIRVMTKELPNGKTKKYTLKPNPFLCNQFQCLVRCEKCPPTRECAHEFTCDCEAYAYRDFCKHSHILAMIGHAGVHDLNERRVSFEIHCDTHESATNLLPSDDISDPAFPLENQEHENKTSRRATILEEHKKKFEEIEQIVNSTTFNDETKDDVIFQLQTLPLNHIAIPSHPSHFPRIDRKRSHPPQNRSFFPSKKKASSQQ